MAWVTAADGTRIHYAEWGDPDGEVVLFLHGLGTDSIGWYRQRRAFGRRYRCLAVDHRGSGRSDKPEGPYHLGDLVADAIGVLDRSGSDRVHVVGASMGGVVAQMIAVLEPDRVRTLTLAGTACVRHRWREELFEDWRRQIDQRGMRDFAVHNLEWIFGPRSVRRLWPVAKLLGPRILSAPAHAFLAQLDALLEIDDVVAAEDLALVQAPTLVVTGSQDMLTPVADAEEIAARIPGADLIIIRGAAHGFMFENAGPFNEVVLEFIDRAETQAEAFGSSPVTGDVIQIRRSG